MGSSYSVIKDSVTQHVGFMSNSYAVIQAPKIEHVEFMGNRWWVIQEERSIFWEEIVSIITTKKIHTNKCLILDGYGEKLFEFTDLSLFDFCLWGWMKSKSYKRELDTREKSFARITDAAARMKKREDQLRRKYAMFAHELQSALRFTVVFSNTYCEM
jgi:hypothetical protein